MAKTPITVNIPAEGADRCPHATVRRYETRRHLLSIAFDNAWRYKAASFRIEGGGNGLPDAYQHYRPPLGHPNRLTAVIGSTHSHFSRRLMPIAAGTLFPSNGIVHHAIFYPQGPWRPHQESFA